MTIEQIIEAVERAKALLKDCDPEIRKQSQDVLALAKEVLGYIMQKHIRKYHLELETLNTRGVPWSKDIRELREALDDDIHGT